MCEVSYVEECPTMWSIKMGIGTVVSVVSSCQAFLHTTRS